MKNLLKIAFILLIALTTSTVSKAQKIAYIDMDSLISMMPEYKVAKDSAQKFVKMLENELVVMQQQFQTEQDAYEKLIAGGNVPAAMKTAKEKRLQDMYQNIQNYQQTAQQDIQAKNDQLSKPIYEKANKAIGEVAKTKGYKMVIDASTTNLLYKDPTDDIMKDVKLKLMIK